MFRFTLNTN